MQITGQLEKNIYIKTEGSALKNIIIAHKELQKALEKDLKVKMEKANELIKEQEIEAKENGFAEGLKEGLNTILSFQGMKKQLLRKMDLHIHEIIKDVLREVIEEEITSNNSIILKKIKRTIEQLFNEDFQKENCFEVKISVNDFEKIKKSQASPDNTSPNNITLENISLSSCKELREGEARIITENGTIEINTKAHLEQILSHLDKISLIKMDTLEDLLSIRKQDSLYETSEKDMSLFIDTRTMYPTLHLS